MSITLYKFVMNKARDTSFVLELCGNNFKFTSKVIIV